MKKTILILFSLIYLQSYGQYIDGPANVRDVPNGRVLFSLNDYVKVNLQSLKATDSWFRILLNCKVDSDDLIDKQKLKANSTLFDFKGDSIGYTKSLFLIKSNDNQNYWKYDELEKIEITIEGNTFESNIRTEISQEELIKTRKSFTDKCESTYLVYFEENGFPVTEERICRLYGTTLGTRGNYEEVFIRETQDITTFGGTEGQNSTITLEILYDYFSEHPRIRKFKADADELRINGNLIETIKYGCCGAENLHKIYNSQSHKHIMTFEEQLLKVQIPNSIINGLFGFTFTTSNRNNQLIGSLSFSDGCTIINKVNFFTKDSKLYKNIVPFIPEMKLQTRNSKDHIRNNGALLELWSQNKNNQPKALTGFSLVIDFMDDSTGEVYQTELKLIDGYINGNRDKEIYIFID